MLGGGAQGSAAAFDLCRREGVTDVCLADVRAAEVPPFLRSYLGGTLRTAVVDATDDSAVAPLMNGMHGVLSALPYYMNPRVTELALEAGSHYCDLGGNTEIVEQQRLLHERALALELSVIPDCGVAPGMVNILAQAGIDALDDVERVEIRVGGLPQEPEPPLNYQIVYSLEGVLDYYTTPAVILSGGRIQEVQALDGMEMVRFPEPVGELEAFYTAGGVSTMPFRYEGRIPEMNYKTLRYPGHADIMRAIRALGLLDTTPIDVRGQQVVPRNAFIAAASPTLRKPEGRDLLALRVEVSGTSDGAPRTVRYDLVDLYDEEHGVTAMMRTTGYSLAVTALMQVDGRVTEKGVHTPDEAMPAGPYLEELARSGVNVERADRVD